MSAHLVSAGRQRVAAAACTARYNEKDESQSISCITDGVILYASVNNNGPTGYGYNYNRIGDK